MPGVHWIKKQKIKNTKNQRNDHETSRTEDFKIKRAEYQIKRTRNQENIIPEHKKTKR